MSLPYCLRAILARLSDAGIVIPYLPRRNNLLGKCVAYRRRFIDGEKNISLHE